MAIKGGYQADVPDSGLRSCTVLTYLPELPLQREFSNLAALLLIPMTDGRSSRLVLQRSFEHSVTQSPKTICKSSQMRFAAGVG